MGVQDYSKQRKEAVPQLYDGNVVSSGPCAMSNVYLEWKTDPWMNIQS